MEFNASVSYMEKEGKTYIKGIAAMDKYIPPNLIPVLTKYLPNQSIIYRHEHPSKGKGEILGTVTEAEAKDGTINFVAEILDYTDFQKKAKSLLKVAEKQNSPMKFSIGYERYGNGETFIDGRPFELGMTNIPVCDECINKEVLQMEKYENMTKEELIEALDKAIGRISDNSEVQKLEENYEKKLQSFKDQLENTNKVLESYKVELENAKKRPVMDKLLEIEQDKDLYDNFYPTRTIEQLESRLEQKKKDIPPIVTKTMNESIKETKQLEDKIQKELEALQKKKESAEYKELFE